LEFLLACIDRLVWVGKNIDPSDAVYARHTIIGNFMDHVTVDTFQRHSIIGAVGV
jgi:hypothetical protein